jgi:hypothetical protein
MCTFSTIIAIIILKFHDMKVNKARWVEWSYFLLKIRQKRRRKEAVNNRRAEKNPIWRENQKEKSKKKKKKKKTKEKHNALVILLNGRGFLWVVVFDRFRKVYIASGMRAFIPLTQ